MAKAGNALAFLAWTHDGGQVAIVITHGALQSVVIIAGILIGHAHARFYSLQDNLVAQPLLLFSHFNKLIPNPIRKKKKIRKN